MALTKKKISQIHKRYAMGDSKAEIARHVGCSTSTVRKYTPKTADKKGFDYRAVIFLVATGVICDMIAGGLSDLIF